MRSSRILLAAVVTGTVAVTGVGASVNAAPAGKCSATIGKAGPNWLAITPPFTAGGSAITDMVSTAFAPDRIYVTNGTEVLRTDDAGCTWSATAIPADGSLGLLPAPVDGVVQLPADSTVADIAAPSSATATDAFYIGYNTKTALQTRPHVKYFDGRHFGEASGLPRTGRVTMLTSPDNSPSWVYALVDPDGAVGDGGIYVSVDGGHTFAQTNSTVRSSAYQDLTADPFVQTTLYVKDGQYGVRRSPDGGKNFEGVVKLGDFSDFAVASGSGTVNFALAHRGSRQFDWSGDGVTFEPHATPVVPVDIAVQPIQPQFAMSDGHSVWLESPNPINGGNSLGSMSVKDVSPSVGGLSSIQMTAPSGAGYAMAGLHRGTLLRATFSLDSASVTVHGLVPVQLLPNKSPHRFPSTLTPGHKTLVIPSGGHRDVPYQLLVPRTPSPIDVMLLVDTTASTEPTIEGMRKDLATIVNDLGAIGLDVQFGLADFRDYSPTVADKGDGEIGDYPYKLRRKIGPVDNALRAALNKLKSAGGGDPAEADLTALYQSTTGAGQRAGGKQVIAPGLDAGYRPDALRLAVLSTDNPFHRESSYLTPSWDSTVAALKANHVYPIGLAVQTVGDNGQPQGFKSYAHETELGQATGSLAPRGGVDCDGNLQIDVQPGSPIVCKVPLHTTPGTKVGNVQVTEAKTEAVHLAPVITTTAASIPDRRTVGLSFTGGGSIAQLVRPAAAPVIDLKADNALDYTVRFSCPRVHKPHTYSIGVDANDGHRVLARSSVKVACGAVPVPPVTHHVPPAAVVALAAPAANAPAPPPPGQPIPNPNPNPNPNPALNANVGFASQEEEQRQLAFAGADAGVVDEEAGVEMSMSRLGGSDDNSSAAYLLGGAAVLMAGAAGYAARTRLRSRYAAAWNHR